MPSADVGSFSALCVSASLSTRPDRNVTRCHVKYRCPVSSDQLQVYKVITEGLLHDSPRQIRTRYWTRLYGMIANASSMTAMMTP